MNTKQTAAMLEAIKIIIEDTDDKQKAIEKIERIQKELEKPTALHRDRQ